MSGQSIQIQKSPLRYPGGKGFLYEYFRELILLNNLEGGSYFEPFAGGAGISLALLSLNMVSEVFLNDADFHIYCFWRAVLNKNDQFQEHIQKIPLSIREWKRQKEIYQYPGKHSIFEIGFSTFYLNRSNRSGILATAGPIGGFEQKGAWRMDARFNKANLIDRISKLKTFKKQVSISNLDAIDFLKKQLKSQKTRTRTFIYLDPPYISAGNRLYLNNLMASDHKALATFLLQQNDLKWVVTYDDAKLIRGLYINCNRWQFLLGYSLQSNQKGKELMIAPKGLNLPRRQQFKSRKWGLTRKL